MIHPVRIGFSEKCQCAHSRACSIKPFVLTLRHTSGCSLLLLGKNKKFQRCFDTSPALLNVQPILSSIFFFFYHSYNCKMFIIIKALAPCIFFTPQLFLTISLGSFLFGHTRTSQLEAWPYSQPLFLGSLQTFLDYLGSILNRRTNISLCLTQIPLHTVAPSIIPKLLPASCIWAQVKSKQGSTSLYSCM